MTSIKKDKETRIQTRMTWTGVLCLENLTAMPKSPYEILLEEGVKILW